MDFEGKVAVITGAASGIGRSMALALARLGTDIVIADIDDDRMEEVRQEVADLGRRALAVHCDVSQDTSVDNLAKQTLSTLGRVDILMNNAGAEICGFLENISMADWEWILGINLFGVIRGIRAFLPHLLERGSGYIINTSSIAGIAPDHGPLSIGVQHIPYLTSKFGVVGLSEGLYYYLRPKGIMVSVLCPGVVRTNFQLSHRYAGDDPAELSRMKSAAEDQIKTPADGESNPFGLMEPDDVARTVVAAMRDNRFLILTHPEHRWHMLERGQDVQKFEEHLQNIFNS